MTDSPGARSDPLGAAAIDFAVAQRALVVNLSPDTVKIALGNVEVIS